MMLRSSASVVAISLVVVVRSAVEKYREGVRSACLVIVVWSAGVACCGAVRPEGLMVVGSDSCGSGMSALRWDEA